MLNRPLLISALHLFALCSFAVAQPLYDLLAQNVEFFVAHRAGAREVLLLVLAVSFGLPLILIGMEAVVGLASSRARQVLHLGFVVGLISATVLITLNRLVGLSSNLVIGLAVAGSLVLTSLYARSQVVQRFCTIASAFALFFPIHLVAFTPLSGMFISAPTAVKYSQIEASTPVVFVLFDEFNVTSLLNARQEIDAARFPNLAALAQDAWWFRRATSVYPETIRAVPAVLTGRTPTQDVVPPSVAGHPDNLFTWLGPSYNFNVLETVTGLCPRTLCREMDSRSENGFDWGLVASDLAVIYLHVLLPEKQASMLLPPIDTGWNGFGADRHSHDAAADADDAKGAGQRRTMTRAEAFSHFISRIEARDKTLDFIHVLLPHSPYVYLPNGQVYPGGFEEGTLPNAMWSDNEYLVRLQYQRFLLQAGYADKLIGDLISKLKQIGKYEKSLIVVTADHGKAFRPGVPKRTLREDNASDVLQIPLFVKLPGQGEGRISDRLVSNLDVLPTIADVLAAKVPWNVDGHSMVAEDFPEQNVLTMQTRKGPEGHFTFDRRSLTSFPRLPWQLDLFGTGESLTALRLRSGHSDLVGRSVAALPVDGHQEKAMVSLETLDALGNIDLRGESLPVYWRGEISGLSDGEKGLLLALALNGTVEAVVPIYSWNDKPFQFSAMIPQAALKAGKNEFRAFLVRQVGMDRRMVELMTTAPRSEFEISQGTDGSETIVSASGRRIKIAPGKVDGWADHLKKSEFLLEISGWAAETEPKVPAAEILIFADGKFIHAGSPNAEREDVSKVLGAPGLVGSGYRFRIPLKTWGKAHSSVRVFGVTRDGQASELHLSETAIKALASRS